MTDFKHPEEPQAVRESRGELDAAIENFDSRNPESLRPVEAALDKLHAALRSAANGHEDSPEAKNFALWRAQFLGLFLDDLELARPEPTSSPHIQEAHEPNGTAEVA